MASATTGSGRKAPDRHSGWGRGGVLPLGRQQPHESRVCLKIWEAGWRQLLAGAAQGSGKQPELYSYCPWAGLSQTTLGDWLRHIQSGESPGT